MKLAAAGQFRGRCADCGHVRTLASIKPGQASVAEIVQLEAEGSRRPKHKQLYARTRAKADIGWCWPCFETRYVARRRAVAGADRLYKLAAD